MTLGVFGLQKSSDMVLDTLRMALDALAPIDDVSRLTAISGWQQAVLKLVHKLDFDPVAEPLRDAEDLSPTPQLLEYVVPHLLP